ncbi:DUF6507 family protein [Streptomyces sp. SL13]|jgi:hypothetical protein|uniref:DUF6507 family protein n=1 Tax=Streptantibioticus silvisoli TaxID=2705255 RepID=A0AA90H3B5_9ACTN|nr:DUF6507 family protein [Streptantibioticus silvisoli]MDI5965543.1 DUF6507 family protein [Streptantibioticus silvisoli]MDI5969940.1 DUF6507 family protein [Streptantibioticus silvisoli]
MAHGQGAWDIDPQGVSSVVGKAATSAEALQGQVSAFGRHLENAANNAGTIDAGGGSGAGKGGQTGGLVAVALGQFAESVQATLKFMGTRSGASLNGAVDATKAYLDGDLTMAADAQHKALGDTAPPPVKLPPQSAAGAPAPSSAGPRPRGAQ